MSFLADADTFVRKVDSGYMRISDVPKADDTDVGKGGESIRVRSTWAVTVGGV